MSPRLDWPAESVSAPTVMKHAVLVCFLQQVVVIQSCVSLTDSVGAGASRYWWNLACRATIHVANDRRASKETHSLPMLIARTVPTVPNSTSLQKYTSTESVHSWRNVICRISTKIGSNCISCCYVCDWQLPVDLSTLSAEEKAARLEKRKPKRKIVVEEKLENTFDINRYSHLWKQKK